MDLEQDADWQALGVKILSIAFDSPGMQEAVREEYGIASPMLVDADQQVSEAYDVLQWAAATGEPGHTFVLVDAEGNVAWVRDYGAPHNSGVMYVPIEEMTVQVRAALASS